MRNIVVVKTCVEEIEEKMEEKGIRVVAAYSSKNLLARLILKLKDRTFLFNYIYPYNRNLINIRENTIIIFDASITLDFLKWIRKLHPEKRIIFWYWNKVETSGIDPVMLKRYKIESWSYASADCEKYNLNYNTTFYFNNWPNRYKHETIDVLFVGLDKGRWDAISNIEREWKKEGIKTHFYVVKDSWRQLKKHRDLKKPVSYQQIVEMIRDSKAILDYYTDEYAGFSLRILEALFFKKKLITNNKNIKKWKFYCQENIFILFEENRTVREFLDLPYKDFSKSDIDYYDFESWIDRFG